jgi:hypothetical protein
MSNLDQRKLEEMAEDLHELIALASQNADKSNLSIVTRFEAFEKKMEEQHTKRWTSFKWAVGVFILLLTLLVPVLYASLDKAHTIILANSQRLSIIETNDKDQPSNKDIEKIVKDIELKLRGMDQFVTHKELGQMKTELYDSILKLHNRDKAMDTSNTYKKEH